jgi:toxin CcdB
MARFDVHRNPAGPGYLLDCQADILADLSTRLVVPLLPPDVAPLPSRRLNPRLFVHEQEVVMMTHFAASVPRSALNEPVASLDDEHDAIMNAFDMLLTGY